MGRSEASLLNMGDMPYQRPEDQQDMELLRRFGVELRRCRLYAEVSQVTLAGRSGVSQSTISRMEHGKASSAAMFKLVRLSAAVGNGLPLGFCPHDHHCAWDRLDADGLPSRNRGPIVSEDYLAEVRAGRTDDLQWALYDKRELA